MKSLDTLSPRDQKRIIDRIDNKSKIIGVDDVGEEYKVTFCDGENILRAFRIKKFVYSNRHTALAKIQSPAKKIVIHLFMDQNEEVKMADFGTNKYKEYLKNYTYIGNFEANRFGE